MVNQVKKLKNLGLGLKISVLMLMAVFAIPQNANSQDFEEWRKQIDRDFQEFQDERDKAFLKMMQEAWETIEAMDPYMEFDEPKPREIPEIVLPDEVPEEPVPVKDATPVKIEIPEVIVDDEREGEDGTVKLSDIPLGMRVSAFNFFDTEVEHVIPSQRIRLQGAPSEQTIQQFWHDMAASDYAIHLNQILTVIETKHLNDWGVLKLVQSAGETLFNGSNNHTNLFTWFVMTKLGFDIRVGYNNQKIYTLFASEYRISGARFFTMDGKRYYLLLTKTQPNRPDRVTTYQGSYPEAKRLFDLDLQLRPLLSERYRSTELSFHWRGEKHSLSIPYNRNIIDYYKNFPNTDFRVYTTASISENTLQAFKSEFSPIINGKTRAEAAEILLRFVQTAFEYKTDVDQFGRQKFMLPEEILYYPYSDCDDRSILYAFLVKHLLGADVVGLHYPGHLATAIYIGEALEGDSMVHENKRFVVADPTYINASIGMTMPRYRNVNPTIIPLFQD